MLQKLNYFLPLGSNVVAIEVVKFCPLLIFWITRVLLIFFFSSLGTAVLDVFSQFLIDFWKIEKLEFQLLDALITNCT